MTDVTFGLDITTRIAGEADARSAAESEVLGQFTQAGRFDELGTEAGAASFEAAVNERMNAKTVQMDTALFASGASARQAAESARRRNRLSAIRDWADEAGSADEFNQGILGRFAASGLSTPAESERYARQQALASFPEIEEQFPSQRSMDQLNAEIARAHSRPYSAYSEYQLQRSEIEASLRDEFAAGGRGYDVGGKEFNGQLEARFIENGLARPAQRLTAADHFRKEMSSEWAGLNIAFAASSLAQGGTELYGRLNSGQFVSGEDRISSWAGLLPGVGALAGTAAGMMIPGVGGWAGGMAGQVIGQIGQSVLGTTAANDQSARQIGETLSSALGEAADAARTFAQAARDTGAPLKDLQQVIGSAMTGGVVTPGSIGGLGAFTNAMGENAVQAATDLASLSRSRPTLYGLGQNLAAGRARPSDFNAGAWEAANRGDFALMTRLQQDAQRAQLIDNPDYQGARSVANEAADPLGIFMDAAAFVGGNPSLLLGRIGRGIWGSHAASGIEENNPANPMAKAQRDLAVRMAGLRSDEAVGAARLGFDEGSLQLSQTRGAFASAADTQEYISDLGTQRRQLSAQWMTETLLYINPATSPEHRSAILEDEYRLAGQIRQTQVAQRGAQRDLSLGIIGEEQASDSYNDLMAQLRPHRPATATDLLPSRLSQASYLERAASSPGLSPTDRFSILGESARTRFNAYQLQYQQEEGEVGVGLSRAQSGVQIASGGGSPEQLYQARTQYTQQLVALERQLNSELERGNLLDGQRTEKRRQLAELSGQIDNSRDVARVGLFSDLEAIDTAGQTSARAGLARDVVVSGNSAYGRLAGPNAASIATLQRDLLAEPNPNSVRARQIQAQLQVALAGQADDVTASQTFRPGLASSTHLALDESSFRVSQMAPYSAGDPNANPMTRGNAVLQDLYGLRAGAQRSLSAATDPIARSQNELQIARYNEEIAGMEHERSMGYARFLPELMLSVPGGGAGAALVPRAGVSAFFNPSQMTGSFGPPRSAGGATGPTPGGYSSFQAATGAGETNDLLRQILSAVRQSGTRPGQTAPRSMVGTNRGD